MGSDNIIEQKPKLLHNNDIIKENSSFLANLFMKYKNYDGLITKVGFNKMTNGLIDRQIIDEIFEICSSKDKKFIYNDFVYFYALLKTKLFGPKLNFLLYFIFSKNNSLTKEKYISSVKFYYHNSDLLYLFLDENIINNDKIEKEDVFNYIKENFEEEIVNYELNREICKFDVDPVEENEIGNEEKKILRKNSYNNHILSNDKPFCLCLSHKNSVCASVDFYKMNSSLYIKYDSLREQFEEYKISNNNIFPLTLLEDMLKEINITQSLIDLISNYIVKKAQKGIISFELFREVLSILSIPLDDEEKKEKNKQIFTDGLFLLFSYPADYVEKAALCDFIQSTKNDKCMKSINNLLNEYDIIKKITKDKFKELIDYLINELIESLEHIKYIPYIFFNFKIIDKKIEKHCIDILLNGEDIKEYVIKKIGTDKRFYIIDCEFWENWKKLMDSQNYEGNNNLVIDTEKICDQNGKINEGLIYLKDFMILPKRIYDLFCEWYGNPPIQIERERIFIEDEDENSLYYQKINKEDKNVNDFFKGEDLITHKKCEIEIYPIFLIFLFFKDMQKACDNSFSKFKEEIKARLEMKDTDFYKFSRKEKFSKLLNILQESIKMELDESNSRLWIYYQDSLEIAQINDSLEKYGIYNKAAILLEINKVGVWPMDEFDLNKKEIKEESENLVGIKNIGNSCYMNSILQIFLNIKEIKDIFIHIKSEKEETFFNFLINYKSEESRLVEEFINLLIEKWLEHKKTLSPNKFRAICGKFNSNFREYVQQDAYDFYIFLIQKLHEGTNIKTKEINVVNKEIVETTENELGNEYWANTVRNNASYIYSLFMGQLQSKLICSKCQKCKIKYEPYSGLDLPLPEEENITLYIKLFRLPLKLSLFKNNFKEQIKAKIKKIKILNVSKSDSKVTNNNTNNNDIINERKKFENSINEQINLEKINNKKEDTLSKNSTQDELKINELNINIPILLKIEIPRNEQCEQIISILQSMKELCLDTNNRYTKYIITSNNKYINPYLIIDNTLEPLQHIEVYQLINFEGIKNIFNYNDLEEKKYSSINHEELSRVINNNSNNINTNEEEGLKEMLFEIKHRVRKNWDGDDYITKIPIYTNFNTYRDFIILLNKKSIKIYDLYEMIWEKYMYFCDMPTKLENFIWWRINIKETEENKNNENENIKIRYCSPFILKIINKTTKACAYCPWFKFCTGCILDPTYKDYISIPSNCYLIVEWCRKVKLKQIKDEMPLLYLNHSSIKTNEIEQTINSKKISIYDCFDLFTKEEILEDIYCENCKEKQIFTKTLKIERIPKYLVISLKRFKYTMINKSKINCPIKFPLNNINLDKYLVDNSQENTKVYDLFAIINHNGSLSEGHYHCIIKQNNKWIKYNDSYVSNFLRTFDTQEAYILVYKLIKDNNNKKFYFNFSGLMDTAFKIYIKQLKFEHIFNYLTNEKGEIIEEYKDNCEFYYGEPVIVDKSRGYLVNISQNEDNISAKIKIEKNYLNIKFSSNKIIKETIKDNNMKKIDKYNNNSVGCSEGCSIY